MSYFRTSRLLHLFLWVWIGLTYLWGLLHLFVVNINALKCWYNAVLPSNCATLQFRPLDAHPWQIGAFTLLMLLYGLLLWAGLMGKSRFPLFSFLAQAGCVFAISFVVRQDNVVLSLYLVLTLEAIDLFQNTRLALLVASASLLLFVVNELLSRGMLTNWTTALFGIWVSTDYPALSLFLAGYLLLYLQFSRAHSQLSAAHTELEEAHHGLAAASTQIAALTRLAERQRLARELHDTLSQGLVGLKLQLEAIDALLIQQQIDHAQQIVRQAMGQIQHTLIEARSAIDDLRTQDATPRRAKEAAEEVLHRFATATGITCSGDFSGLEMLALEYREHLMRFLGEGLTNIARHAQASHIWVTTHLNECMLRIELRDDGIGFDPTLVAHQSGHYGLLGLGERARLLHGHLSLQSAPGAGTCLSFSFPVHPPEVKSAIVQSGDILL